MTRIHDERTERITSSSTTRPTACTPASSRLLEKAQAEVETMGCAGLGDIEVGHTYYSDWGNRLTIEE